MLKILVLGLSTEVLPERREAFCKPSPGGGGRGVNFIPVANCFFFPVETLGCFLRVYYPFP